MLGDVPLFGVTESHVSPAGFVVAVAEKFSAVVPSVLVRAMFCVVIAPEPTTATALIAPGLKLISGVVLTFSVTGIERGALVEPGTEIVTVPLHVCGMLRPAVFTAIATCEVWPACTCVVPELGDAFKKPGHVVVLTATV